MKCNFRPTTSEPAENTSINSNNSNNPVETQVHKEARDPDDKDEVEDEDDLTLPETADNHGRDNILSKITEDDQKEILQHNRMLLKLVFEQSAEWKKERT